MVATCLVVGYSDSGKTTLVEGLLGELTARGLKVATAKGHRGSEGVDQPGKDSWRHRKAGAAVTFLSTGAELAAFMDRSYGDDPRKIAALCPPDIDILLVEGFKETTGLPKVAVGAHDLFITDPDVICLVRSDDPDACVPLYAPSDVSAIVDCILEKTAGQG